MHPMFQVLDTPGHSVSRRRSQDGPQETPIRLLGIQHNMWLDAKSQRRKVIDAAIEVAEYLYKNDNLRIDQRLKVISMCLPFFSPSQHHSSIGPNPTSNSSQPYGSDHIRTPGT